MTDEPSIPPLPSLLDAQGRPARPGVVTCPQCRIECPKGDASKRTRSSGFGSDVHDVCCNCGYEFRGELTV